MDKIFQGDIRNYALSYLDDIIIFSNTLKEHESHLKSVLQLLKKFNLVLNPSKCKLCKTEVDILGRTVTKGIVKPNEHKIKALREFIQPTTVKELRSFLGLVNFSREFIPNLAEKAAPLFKLLEGESKRSIRTLRLVGEAGDAFKTLKNYMTSNTMRYQPNLENKFIVTTDASDFAIEAVLSQLNDAGKEQAVHYFSKSLVKAERNYSTTDKELVAIIKSLAYFRKYLLGKNFY